jgi:hypothetical protein
MKFVVLSGKIVAVTLSACNHTACTHAVNIKIDTGSYPYYIMLICTYFYMSHLLSAMQSMLVYHTIQVIY